MKVDIKIQLECKLHFLVHNLCCDKLHWTNVSESIEAKYWVSWLSLTFNKRANTSYQNCLEFAVLSGNRSLQIEVARQKKRRICAVSLFRRAFSEMAGSCGNSGWLGLLQTARASSRYGARQEYPSTHFLEPSIRRTEKRTWSLIAVSLRGEESKSHLTVKGSSTGILFCIDDPFFVSKSAWYHIFVIFHRFDTTNGNTVNSRLQEKKVNLYC